MKQTTTFFSLCLLFSYQVLAAPELTTETAIPGDTVIQEVGSSAGTTSPEPAAASEPAPVITPLQTNTDAAPATSPQANTETAPAPAEDGGSSLSHYLIAPGDALLISVWKEEGLQDQQYLVSPDGNIIFPLIGTINVGGKTTTQIKDILTTKLSDYISEPSITVKLLNNQGNTIFVIGKVAKPGQYFTARKIDVLQALSLAGGLTVYASEGSISILRRNGNQTLVFPFDYSDVIKGEDLEQNILLEPGDTVTVP
ncbi:MAG: polysaccharide biosynthesis/export family protein [Methylococcales bacterium]|nr:polysaccharide biosynthesis/export family protein [Methylococcales bacterium]